MLIGTYVHILDNKWRLLLPSKFRQELGRKVVVTRGLDSCLFLFSLKEWQKVAGRLAELPMGARDSRGFNRFMLSGAADIDIDSIGRIVIPEFLRTFAHLKSKVVLAGIGSRVEIWDASQWERYQKSVEKQADQLAEKLGDIGMI